MAEKKIKLSKAQVDTLKRYAQTCFRESDVRQQTIDSLKALGFIEVAFKEVFRRTYIVTEAGHEFLRTEGHHAVMAISLEYAAGVYERRYGIDSEHRKGVHKGLLDRAKSHRELAETKAE